MSKVSIPIAVAAIADSNGAATPQYYRFFRETTLLLSSISDDINALALASPTGSQFSENANVVGNDGLTSRGNLKAGIVVVSLANLDDSGIGTFKLITRDNKGRLLGTANGSTSDVPEGTNLYYTDARASAAAPIQSISGTSVDNSDPRNPIISSSSGHYDGGNASSVYTISQHTFNGGSA